MSTRKSRREVLERLDRALNLVDEIEGMYAGWRPRGSGSERKHDNGFSIQTPFDQDYEVADTQNREDARRAEKLGNDMYDGRGDFNGMEAVRSWESEQDEGESPHVRRNKARDEDEEDEEEDEVKAREDEEDEEEDEEGEDEEEREFRGKGRRKARDEDEEEEFRGGKGRKARDEDDMKARDEDEEDEEAEDEEDEEDEPDEKARRKGRDDDEEDELDEEKSRKARHRSACRCMKCLIRKADSWEKALAKNRKARKGREVRGREEKGREVRKSLTMADMYEVSSKSFRTMEALSKALPAVRDAVAKLYATNDTLADEVFELREDLNAFMAAPSRKSRVKTEERPRRQEAPVRDFQRDMQTLSKSLEALRPDSVEAQQIVKDIAAIELGYPDQVSPYARSILKQQR